MASERQTLVMEFTCPEPVGTDQAGSEKVRRYLRELAEMLGQAPLRAPVTHLSPKYGLSGWLPLQRSSAIHLYAWDDREPAFVSVDISTRRPLEPERFARHAGEFFGLGNQEVVLKSTDADLECRWRELDDSICRQRLALRGRLARSIEDREARDYLLTLCDALRMAGLSEPLLAGGAAWMHWETSGVIMAWERGLEIDIYTCKPFCPEDAAALTRSLLPVAELSARSY